MSEIGAAVREIRKGSRYRDLISFSLQASLSREGLRKIENGERIPNRDTLARILEVAETPADRTDELMRLRDNAQAKRDGLALPRFATPDKIDRMATRVTTAVEQWLETCDDLEIPLPDKEKRKLRTKLTQVLQDEMRD